MVKINEIYDKYSTLLTNWQEKFKEETSKIKNTQYHNDERCLIERLIVYKDEHLRFVTDFKVPFDNNLAERSLRMIKTKIKVSGGFRSENGSTAFANIRSLVDTANKRKINIYHTFRKIFMGEPVPLLR